MSSDQIQELLRKIDIEYDIRKLSRPEIKERCRHFFTGKAFVSHTAADSEWCRRHIVSKIRAEYGYDGCFFLSMAQGSIAEFYRVVVEYSFYFSKTIIFAISERSAQSNWARLEAQWAVEQRHPSILCLVDGTPPARLNPDLEKLSRFSPSVTVDFSQDESAAEHVLWSTLSREEFAIEPGSFPTEVMK
jgi:TIR domain